MRITYDTAFRPNYELMLALNWLICGILCALVLIFSLEFPLQLVATMTGGFFAIALYQGAFARKRFDRLQKLQRQERNFLTLEEIAEFTRDDGLFLGRGFDWTISHAQQISDLYLDPEFLASIKARQQGATFLHGVGAGDEAPIYFADDESRGHVHIIGSTGTGKTRLIDLIATQCALRGEPLLVIDPKGDQELKNNIEAVYARLGRQRDFTFFHPAYIDESAAINPLASRQRSSELASRLAAVIPSSASGDVFKSFSQNALNGIFFAVEMSKTNPTIMDVQRALSEGFAPLCIRALEGWAYDNALLPDIRDAMGRAQPRGGIEKKAELAALFYQNVSSRDRTLDSAEMNNLISLLLHDRDHFRKMVSSLVPVVGKLCAGPLATLFSPDPEAGRMPKSGRVISLSQVVDNRGACYIGLDTLSDQDVGRAIGQMIMADIASLIGKKYNFGRDGGFINVIVDEASEVANEQLIQLLNKSRGAGVRMFVATQTLSDYEARTGSKAMANMLIGNMNSTIMLRTIDPDTQKALAERLPEVPIQYVMKTTGSSMGEKSHTGAFAVNHGERLMKEDKPIVAPQSLGDLSDLEFFAVFARGNLVKGRLPILIAPDDSGHLPEPTHFSEQLFEDPISTDPFFAPDNRQSMIVADTAGKAGVGIDGSKVERPEIIIPEARDERPHRPQRKRFMPLINWVDVLPGFRPEDPLVETRPDPYADLISRHEPYPGDEHSILDDHPTSDEEDRMDTLFDDQTC